MKRIYLFTLLLGCVSAAPAFADSTVDSKLRCQMDYGSGSDLDIACERGVGLAERSPDKLDEVLKTCRRETQDARKAAACQRGVELRAHAGDKARGDGKSTFSYSWKQGSRGVGVNIGDYQARVGDAEQSIEECMRAYEGSSSPPSCLSGFKVQPKPPGAPPLGREP